MMDCLGGNINGSMVGIVDLDGRRAGGCGSLGREVKPVWFWRIRDMDMLY